MNDRVLSFLGICRRAKKLVIGAEVTAESVQTGKAELILYASDASQNSLKSVKKAAQEQNVPMRCVNRDKQALSLALGRLCAMLSVEDRGFAQKLCQMLDSESERRI